MDTKKTLVLSQLFKMNRNEKATQLKMLQIVTSASVTRAIRNTETQLFLCLLKQGCSHSDPRKSIRMQHRTQETQTEGR